MGRWRDALLDRGSSVRKAADLLIQLLIAVSLLLVSISTLPNLTPTERWWLDWAEIVIVAVFTAEYLIRLLVAERKLAYVFSFMGLVDLFAIAPSYLSLGGPFITLRGLRFFRLFRILKLTRYSRAMQRFRRAFAIAKEELALFSMVTMLLLYFAAAGIYFFENEAQPEKFASIFHSLWWAVATLTTVGYGDIYPVTTGGKIFTFVILLIGLGIVAVPAGLVSSALARAREMED